MTTPILILDGGLGTSLEEKYHIKFGPSTPLWSSDLVVSAPHTLLQCQADFGRLPVDILLTATYQVSIEGFANTCESHASFPEGIDAANIPQFLERAVCIAESATRQQQRQQQPGGRAASAGSVASVALSLGPYGACMSPSQEYSGRYDEQHDSQDALYEWHRERLALFAKVDGLSRRVAYLAMETIPRVDEIAAMRRALDTVPELADVRFWMSCLYPSEGEALPTGESVKEALRTMLDKSLARSLPWGVGINCTNVRKVPTLLQRYEEVMEEMVSEGLVEEWPALVLYPDGTKGEVYNSTTKKWEMPQDIADKSAVQSDVPWEQQLADAVRATQSRGKWKQIVVGGCCRATSEDIARLRMILL
ncbi:hypothetical protein E4U17_002608 [Claviceps sp. LM77 group G4]|nr:hypothetical protein E4U17_002608 [Claviceps sp. LM77 group G4]KAG6074117.1 hypothetical protein E4U33_002649 [Claviceps sp. LM78 group G4]KAG6076047.1 hypothetical protein E4U16_003006 [Claviceps sp. LM84 group G4]